jgi:sialate O-acetylesterase
VLYNGMIAPIAGFASRGVVWYQGETNTAYPKEYKLVLASLVKSWRAAWSDAGADHRLDFLVVQLPNYIGATRDGAWATLRESQAAVATNVPAVGLAITIDVGETKDIHPKDKLTVGKRLSLLAQKRIYDRDVECYGPTPKSLHVVNDTAIVDFDQLAGGLVAKGELSAFEIAGDDGKYVPALAKIDGQTVVVRAPAISQPKSVRYAWSNDPKATLFNKADLPAAPFEAKAP